MTGFMSRCSALFRSNGEHGSDNDQNMEQEDNPPPYELIFPDMSSVDDDDAEWMTIVRNSDELSFATMGEVAQAEYKVKIAQWRRSQLRKQHTSFEVHKQDHARRCSGTQQRAGAQRGGHVSTSNCQAHRDNNHGPNENDFAKYTQNPFIDWTLVVDPLRLFLVNCLINDYGTYKSIDLTPAIDKGQWRALQRHVKWAVNGNFMSSVELTASVYVPAAVLGIHWVRVGFMLKSWSSSSIWNELNRGSPDKKPMDTHDLAYKMIVDREVVIPTLFAEPLPVGLDPRLRVYLLDDLDFCRKRYFHYLKSVDDYAVRPSRTVPPYNTKGRGK